MVGAIVLDTSALVALLLQEPEAEQIAEILASATEVWSDCPLF